MKLFKYILTATFLVVMTSNAYSQTGILSGKVTEIFGGKAEPMMGVNVTVVNNQNRTLGGGITDINGTYNIKIPNEKNLTIVFSYIGMKTERVKYTGQEKLNMTLKDDSQTMSEVVVQAERLDRNEMGITARQQVSATQKVNMDELVATSPVSSIEDALQGQLGGVDIILGGGDPGARASIQIRGTSTLNANSDPLIVIDGIPYPSDISEDTDFSNLNNEDLGALLNISPQDIASIEVLKDAAATAIWGTKGANGVLMITTKKGTVGKTRFTFSSKFSAKREPSSIPMLNGNQYKTLISEAIWNSANYSGLSNRYLDLLFNTPEIANNQNWAYYDEYAQNTDWLATVRQNTHTWDNNFSMSGGGEKATYRFALGYLDEGGTTIGTGMNRINSSLDITYKFSDKLKFTAYFSYSQTDKDENYYNVRTEAFRKMPNKSPYYIDDKTGEYTSVYFNRYNTNPSTSAFDGAPSLSEDSGSNYNPIAMAKESRNNTLQNESKINVRAEYKFLKDLTYRGYVSLNIRNTKGRMFLPQVATGLPWDDPYSNRSTDTSADQLTISTENQLMYIRNWNDRHNLVANAIWRTSETSKKSYGSQTSGNPSSDLSDPVIGSTVQKKSSSESKTRSLSGVLNANYTYLNRYVFNITANIEGNSAMGRSERWGVFPAAGVAWHLQDEPFMREIKWLQELKLRFSAGQSGKAASGTSLYLGSYQATGDNYMGMGTIIPKKMQLNRLKWETTTEYNTGADISLLKGRLRFTVDVYQKFTKDLLQRNVTIPSSLGYGSDYTKMAYFNSGKMTNRGWEFRTDVVFYEKKDLRIAGFFNIARNTNKLTEMPDNYSEENYSFKNGEYAYRWEVGRPIGSFFGYRYLGVYQNKDATYARDAEGNIMNDVNGSPIVMQNGTAPVAPGDAIYEDINHDGVINEYDIVYLGNSQPRFTGGCGLNISYKNFRLSANFYGRYGQDVINSTRMSNESMYGTNNQSTAVLRRWRNEGDITDIPRALYNEGYNYLGSDRFVEDASYLRLKSLSLTYKVPNKLCQNWGLNSLEVYVTGYNLFTWTKYTGQDPEVKTTNTYAKDSAITPISKQFTCGINLSF